jgi:hypothetical protein
LLRVSAAGKGQRQYYRQETEDDRQPEKHQFHRHFPKGSLSGPSEYALSSALERDSCISCTLKAKMPAAHSMATSAKYAAMIDFKPIVPISPTGKSY